MTRHPASFRDPSGYLFTHDGTLYRAIQPSYQEHYEHLVSSGLMATLEGKKLLVLSQEIEPAADMPEAWKIIQPEPLPFISYPYEWCFHQLKQAALHTLKVQELAMEHGMTLKDASAYNIQFVGANPVFIDHLSFEVLEAGKPWAAYRQFCEHFLGPLALMHYKGTHLLPMLQAWPDGLPLSMVAELLPGKSRLKSGLLMHVHMHQKAAQGAEVGKAESSRRLKSSALGNLIRNLAETVESLSWSATASHWQEYIGGLAAENYLEPKEQAVQDALRSIDPQSALVLGANTGHFAKMCAAADVYTVALESDATCVQEMSSANNAPNLLPLVMGLDAPSPALGFDHRERMSLEERGPADVVMALALIHHLCIGRNIPLPQLAQWLARLGNSLLVEWVPKSDERTKWLLANRADVFEHYTEADFQAAFEAHFTLESRTELGTSGRILYHFTRTA